MRWLFWKKELPTMAKTQRKMIVARRLTMKDLGDPSPILKKKEGESMELGSIIGKVIGKKERPDRFDPRKMSIGFIGVFRGTPADQSKPIVQAQVLYLPEFYQDQINAALEKGGEGAEIPFHCGVIVTRQAQTGKGKNKGAGYRYDVSLQTEGGRGVDPLAELYDRFKVEKPLLLEGPGAKGKKKK